MRFALALCAVLYAMMSATVAIAEDRFPDVTLIVGFAPGQGIDQPIRPEAATLAAMRLSPDAAYAQTARFVAANLGRFLPGSPAIVVRNMPGAGGLNAARHLAGRSASDGSVLGMVGSAPFYASLFDEGAALRGLRYVGARLRETFVCVAWSQSILRTLDDARATAVFAGSLGASSRGQAQLAALNALVGTQFRIVGGYASTFELSRALSNGEIEAACGYTMTLLETRHGDWLREGKLVLLTRFGGAPFGWRTQVPQASESVAGAADRSALNVLDLDGDLVWSLVAPPDIGPQRLAQLRSAFDTMLEDSEVLRLAGQQGLKIDPIAGEDLQRAVDAAHAMPSASLERVRAFLDPK